MARSIGMVRISKYVLYMLIIACNVSCLGCEDVIDNYRKEQKTGLSLIHDSISINELRGKYYAAPASSYYNYTRLKPIKDSLYLKITNDSLKNGYGGSLTGLYYSDGYKNRWFYKFSNNLGGQNHFDLFKKNDTLGLFYNLYRDSLKRIHIIGSYYDDKTDSKIDIINYVKQE